MGKMDIYTRCKKVVLRGTKYKSGFCFPNWNTGSSPEGGGGGQEKR